MKCAYGFRKLVVALGMVCVFGFSVAAAPAYAEKENQFDIYAAFQSFTWKEFDDAGERLLKEHGPLGGVGFSYHADLGGKYASLTLQPRIELFGGTVDYDGQTTTGTPVMSDTDYFGLKLEFDVGGKFGGKFAVEPFGGLGIRTWWRDINNSYTLTGTYVYGYTEQWYSFYGRLGVKGDLSLGQDNKLFLEAGVKLPISTTNYIDDINVTYEAITLKPGNKTSLFAEAGVKLHLFRISAFYDSMRFKKSPIVYEYDPFLPGVVAYWQPKSEADIYGVRIGVSF